MSRRRTRPWWEERWGVCRVHHSSHTSYLIHYPQWGTPLSITWAPRDWCLVTPGDFLVAGLFGGLFPMKKPLRETTERVTYAASREGLSDYAPVLADHLVLTAYDGDPPGSRSTSTLLIFAQDGQWKACLRDRQEGQCLWVAARTFPELAEVLESALGDPSSVWRADRMAGAAEATRQKPGKKS